MTTQNLGRVVGFSILSGAGVPSGGLGDNGDSYLNTTNGDVYSKVGGAWSITGNIQGIQGEQGFSILSGAGAPTTQGVNGDTYLNTTNGDLYLKASGVWGSPIGSIRGPQGIQGIQGPIGISTTNMTTAGTILGLNTADSVPQSPKQLSLVGASIVANVFTINYQNAVTAYNASSGVNTPLTNAMSPLQMFQNLQKQNDNRFTKAESQQLVDDIKIGGRNYQPNSEVRSIVGFSPVGNVPVYYIENNNELRISGINASYLFTPNFIETIPSNETVTLSFWVKNNSAIATTLVVSPNGNNTLTSTNIAASQGWTKVTGTGLVSNLIAGTQLNSLLFEHYTASTFDVSIKQIKLEKGNKATDWTPAPEDVQAAIDDKVPATIGVAPASATAIGTAGTVIFDANYIYVCTATNTWKRTALTTW